MEFLIGLAGKWLWPVLAGAAAILALFGWGGMKKRQGRQEQLRKDQAEGARLSAEAEKASATAYRKSKEEEAYIDPITGKPGPAITRGRRGPKYRG